MLTAGFFVVVMMAVLLGMERGWLAENSGPNPDRWEFAPLNIRQVSLFFTLYVLFQVWNMINCRSLTPESSGLVGFWRNRSFMGIMLAIIVGQVVIVTFGGAIFSLEPLSVLDWLILTAATASVLAFAEVVRRLRPKA